MKKKRKKRITIPVKDWQCLEVNGDPKDGFVAVCADVGPDDGRPKVVMYIRTDADILYEAKLNGHRAIAIVFTDELDGTANGPWELGHLLAKHWEEAKKLADEKKAQSSP